LSPTGCGDDAHLIDGRSAYLATQENLDDYYAALRLQARVRHRLGEVLAMTVNHKGGRAAGLTNSVLPKEIYPMQSSRSQQLARVMTPAELVEQNLKLVYWVARRVRGRPRRRRLHQQLFDEDDFIASGMVGLVAAAREFDPARGNKFSTLAVVAIRRRLINALHAMHHDRERLEQLDFPQDVLAAEAPDGVETAESVGRLLDGLKPREQELLRMRFWQNQTQRDVARAWGVTRQAVQQAEQKALATLRRRLARVARDV